VIPVEVVTYAEEQDVDNLMHPSLMKRHIPQWFRDIPFDRGTAKDCPSFINLFKHGFLVRLAQDYTYSAVSAEGAAAGCHPSNQFGKYPFPDGMLYRSVKFYNPFWFAVNREVTLMILPCWWSESYKDVQAIHGMVRLSPGNDLEIHINTHIRAPAINESITLPAGTPLAQLVFVDIPEVSLRFDNDFAHKSKHKRDGKTVIERIKKWLVPIKG
tara:strand:+ start:1657 stop:2298 length:642 start_codon:yes stop_codon:yes gene_type:complete